jgi:hypothetical protein
MMLGFGKHGWSEEKLNQLSTSLGTVFLEEWGGPRSPLALQYLHEKVIPNLVYCFCNNANLLQNFTFAEIVAWKLKSQFGYPKAIAEAFAKDLLVAALHSTGYPQVTDVREPWRRIFRAWVSGESLPNISERTGYPLEYLDLLRIRLKKVSNFVASRSVTLLECLQNDEMREFGIEQLSFLYNFHTAITGEPLFKERLALEQVIYELDLPLDVPDLVALLEVVQANEGKLDKQRLATALREFLDDGSSQFGGARVAGLVPQVVNELLRIYWLQENRDGRITLSELSAKNVAGFILPKLALQVAEAVKRQELQLAREIYLRQNPEVLVRMIDWTVNTLTPAETVQLLTGLYKQVNRRIDIHLIVSLGKLAHAFDFVLACLEERDSLIKAKACIALGTMGNKAAVDTLVELLKDPVPGVREHAAIALGQLKATECRNDLEHLARDYAETLAVRESAIEALRCLDG